MLRIENSHLVRTACTGCGGVALAAEEKAREALCGTCWAARTGAGGRYTGGYTVPVGYPMGVAVETVQGCGDLAEVSVAGPWERSLRGVEGPARGLAAAAMGAGWTVCLRRSGKTWAVRGEQDSRYFLAVHIEGSGWRSLWGWGGPEGMRLMPAVGVLGEWIEHGGRVWPGWWVGVRTGLHMAGLKAEWLKETGVKRGTQGKRKEAGG
jgi:hypothetical protein